MQPSVVDPTISKENKAVPVCLFRCLRDVTHSTRNVLPALSLRRELPPLLSITVTSPEGSTLQTGPANDSRAQWRAVITISFVHLRVRPGLQYTLISYRDQGNHAHPIIFPIIFLLLFTDLDLQLAGEVCPVGLEPAARLTPRVGEAVLARLLVVPAVGRVMFAQWRSSRVYIVVRF